MVIEKTEEKQRGKKKEKEINTALLAKTESVVLDLAELSSEAQNRNSRKTCPVTQKLESQTKTTHFLDSELKFTKKNQLKTH